MLSTRPDRARSVSIPLAAACACALAAASPAQNRSGIPAGGTNWAPQPQPEAAGLVTQDMATGGETPTSVVQALLGSGATVSNVQYKGAAIAAGTFTGGSGIIGFQQGVVLSSGNVASIVGPQNVLPDTSTDNLLPGDPDLDQLVSGGTLDATVLEFDFSCPTASVISFQYVFASEEYDEYVNTIYNDVFAFFLNGQNIALVPNTGQPVAINNVNCDNPYNPPNGQNCAQYVTNDCDSLGLGYPCTNLATELDGLTVVFSAIGTLVPGPNHIKLAIADRGDHVWDSDVFVRGQSFSCGNPGPAFEPPTPCGETLDAWPDVHLQFEVEAIATNGHPNQTVVLDVTGDPAPLAGGSFTPPLPAGPAAMVETEFEWKPDTADVGVHQLHFTATDQLQQVTQCDVTIDVHPPPGVPYGFGDGTGTACPCGNYGNSGHGCANSATGDGARLYAGGFASVSADSLVLYGVDLPDTICLYVQGTLPVSGVLYGDGLRVVGGPIKRLGFARSSGGESQYPDAGQLPISARGFVPPAGGTFYYQIWYRDPDPNFCAPATINASNGYAVTWVP
jgi:hypothetical protein